MKKIEIIKAEWKKALAEMHDAPAFSRILRGELELKHYKSLLKQIALHARENPQIQAFATAFFRGEQRQMVKMFFKHATQEIGHDQLALDDLKVLGEDVSQVPFERPLPATSAMIAYAFYQIQFRNPIGYLGYLFHLEFMPTSSGFGYMEALKKAGVPESAMSFIHEHATVDIAHNKLMEEYVDELIQTEEDLQEVIYAARVTARLYERMLEEAFQQADKAQDWGTYSEEIRRSPSATISRAAA